MSILWGILKESGSMVSAQELESKALATARYATGPAILHTHRRLGMAYQPYESHRRSALERGPCIDGLGNTLTFDGRLDNVCDLANELKLGQTEQSDSQFVLAAFRKWGTDCFRHLTGDWALALWSPKDQRLYLARDHAGTRTLYYHSNAGELRWGTYLESLLTRNETPSLCPSYVAAYLSGLQLRNLTPYEGICAVPPGHFIVFRDGCRATVTAHWRPIDVRELKLSSDHEYEEAFLTLFKQAVRRRTDNIGTVLAELSGGMDSTSIVCLSDHLQRSERPGEPLLETVSYFDDDEASLDEKRYFSITEAARNKVGAHLQMGFSQRTFLAHDTSQGRYLLPGADSLTVVRERQFLDSVWNKGYRSLLSGIGGDELLGGVPDPLPELGGYLSNGKLSDLFRKAIAWSLMSRSPLLGTLMSTRSYVCQLYRKSSSPVTLPAWLSPTPREIAEQTLRNHTPTRRSESNVSQLVNDRTWWAILETLPHLFPRLLARYEYRYPFLDKDLVNFLLAIPREQLLRPNRRRSLMRRAMSGIVPPEILERKVKAFQLQGVLRSLRDASLGLEDAFRRSYLVDAGYIQPEAFRFVLRQTAQGDPALMRTVLRTIALELWLHSENTATHGGGMNSSSGLAA